MSAIVSAGSRGAGARARRGPQCQEERRERPDHHGGRRLAERSRPAQPAAARERHQQCESGVAISAVAPRAAGGASQTATSSAMSSVPRSASVA